MAEFNKEMINDFLSGRDPMERIVSIECDFNEEDVSIIFLNNNNEKRVRMDDFKPFVWAKNSVAVRMYDGDRKYLKKRLNDFGIGVRALTTKFENSKESDRLNNGYKLLFYAKRKMSFQKFLMFFNDAGTPIYAPKKKKTSENTSSNKEFLAVSPVEQYMMYSGKRLFKGYENYDNLKRLLFDLETQGLDPQKHAIDQIGIRTNKGFEKIISVEGEGEERLINELDAIIQFLQILANEKPDVIAGHNSENFDWNFIEKRCEVLGTNLYDLSLNFFKHPIYKKSKETVLKLGGEVEYYKPTIMWGHNIVDSLHAVRRAQAIDSNMKSASLKYVTKYLNLKKENRVYVKGDQIGTIWLETEPIYAFNDNNGDYYKVSETKPLLEDYQLVSGKYIVERYLLDDIYETDKIELKLNESNFLISKILPTTFQRACTMGTAGIWKLILLAWCFENNLAVPAFGNSQRFTGGLSRLLRVGYADNVVKLDFNSLYPSIILTWNIGSNLDISNSMLMMLEYVLTQREKYKDLKGEASKKAKKIKKIIKEFNGSKEELIKLKQEQQYWEAEASANDKKQLPLKILANSFFGSFGAPNVFPFGDVVCAEKTTCIGRMSLRLMIHHFTNLNYIPIVGDSVLGDTPLFIKYNKSNLIDIKPISEIIDLEAIKTDVLGREYDYSKKYFKILCRSGWEDVKYVYRHKTDKDIYNVNDGVSNVDVTEDHSLFDENKMKIKPSEVSEDTKLEYHIHNITDTTRYKLTEQMCITLAKMVLNGTIDRVPLSILNAPKECKEIFLKTFEMGYTNQKLNKTCQAGILFLKNNQ